MIAWVLAVLAALVPVTPGASGRTSAVNAVSYYIGGVIGIGLVIGLLALIARLLGGAKAAYITMIVVAGLVLVGGMGARAAESARTAETRAEIEAAVEAIGREPNDFRPNAAEVACLEGHGLNEDELHRALTDRSTAGGEALVDVAEVLFLCIPRIVEDRQWIESQANSLSSLLGTSISVEETECYFREIITNPNPRGLLDGTDTDSVLAAFQLCMTPENFAIITGAPGTGPQNYGDDAAFDRMHDLCGEGNEYACDLLLWFAAAESEYYIYGYDCAGRGTDRAFCTAGIDDTDVDGWADDDSVGWPKVRDDCEAGDMLACDFAFRMSVPGSVWARTGETCGGRLPFAPMSCVDRFGEQAPE